MDWEAHCPIDEHDHPAKRQAWKGGWMYCMEHGPGTPDPDAAREMAHRPALLSVWLQGYSAADRVQREEGA